MIHRNVSIADSEKNLVCQDTGIAIYYAQGRRALRADPSGSTRRCATARRARRSSTRCARTPCTRSPVRTPAEHRLPPADRALGVRRGLGRARREVVPKGSGSENMSFLKMCVPADGVDGIKKFVLDWIVDAGGKPCRPASSGSGSAAHSTRRRGWPSGRSSGRSASRRPPAGGERRWAGAGAADGWINMTGIGPQGLGGKTPRRWRCHIEYAWTHITMNPVAVNLAMLARRGAPRPTSAPTAPSTTTARHRDGDSTKSRSRSPIRRRS